MKSKQQMYADNGQGTGKVRGEKGKVKGIAAKRPAVFRLTPDYGRQVVPSPLRQPPD
jgi:hypothetical protein